LKLAKQWHPDRIAPELAELRDTAAWIFGKMSEAHQVLSNEELRREYERLMQERGASPKEQARAQCILRALAAFQKAEVLIRKGNLAEAEHQAQIAAENDPEQAEYIALYADILAQRPERAASGKYEDVIGMVNDARKKQPDNLKVRLCRARVLKRSGDHDNAYREFKRIAEKDPNNIEAARAARMHEMRGGKPATAETKRDGKGTDPMKTEPMIARGGETKDLLSQNVGQIFGRFFKR
jgi:tetratricopeptide (TPR) repeat protein